MVTSALRRKQSNRPTSHRDHAHFEALFLCSWITRPERLNLPAQPQVAYRWNNGLTVLLPSQVPLHGSQCLLAVWQCIFAWQRSGRAKGSLCSGFALKRGRLTDGHRLIPFFKVKDGGKYGVSAHYIDCLDAYYCFRVEKLTQSNLILLW